MSHVKLANLALGQIGRDLIADPGKHLGHLSGWPIVYVFEGGWKGDKETLFGRVSMKSHLAAVALRGLLVEGEEVTCDNTEKCFLIEVNEDFWNIIKDEADVDLLREQQMYHLLCACVVDDKGNPSCAKPDIKLFTEEVAVYGETNRSIEMLLKRLKERRPTGADGSELPFNDVELDAEQWKRAGWIADRLVNPKGRWLEGTAPGVLTLSSGETLIPTMADMVRRPGAEKPERYLRALLVSEETEEEKTQAPELPFDSRWPSAGMRLRFKPVDTNAKKGEDEDHEEKDFFPLVRVREVDFRCFAPAELQPKQTTIFEQGVEDTTVEVKAEGGDLAVDVAIATGQPEPKLEVTLSMGEKATTFTDSDLDLTNLGEMPLRVTPRLFETALMASDLSSSGEGGEILHHGGSRYVVWKVDAESLAVNALRVKPYDAAMETKEFNAYGASFIGMRILNREMMPWVIVADTVYNLVNPEEPAEEVPAQVKPTARRKAA